MKETNLTNRVLVVAGVALLVFVLGIATLRARAGVEQNDPKSICGTVLNSSGQKPEAGVWVIAETTSLPTPYRKIVVTNDDGKFVVPDLPQGDYQVWVRGYGLRDSSPVKGTPGSMLKVQVSTAATPQEAAKVYPASYWLSLFQAPSNDELQAAPFASSIREQA